MGESAGGALHFHGSGYEGRSLSIGGSVLSISTNDETSVNSPSGDQSDSKAAVATQAVKEQATGVAAGAVDRGKEVAGQASSAAGAVAGEAKNQVQDLVHRTRGELMDQAESRGQQAASGLRTLSDQLSALGDGRSGEAGRLPEYLEQARTRVSSLAERLEQGGPQGVLDDVTAFARRRPGLFLVGAVGTGFLVGRLVRSGAAASGGEGGAPPSPPAGLSGRAPRAIGTSPIPPAPDVALSDVGIVGEPLLPPTSPVYEGGGVDVGELP
jgi:hypothetical protein